jgi:1-acyl-sn-glycerol-3-phosphate acyltransferase
MLISNTHQRKSSTLRLGGGRVQGQGMGLFYWMSRLSGRFAFLCTMRTHVLHAERNKLSSGYVLALTHLSHLEPMCACVLNKRPIDWMTRKEFFKYRGVARYLEMCNAFRVNRQGIPVSAVRTAIERAWRGRVIGICPEGGVASGARSALRGGAIKRGCCSVAIRAEVPIVPCVMLGTDKLNRVGPWLPFKRAEIWVAYGEAIAPPAGVRSTRATRRALAERLSEAYQALYAELRETYGIEDASVP